MHFSSFFILLSVFVYNVFCQDGILTSLNGNKDPMNVPLARADDTNTTDMSLPDLERQKKIREQYYQDKRFRESLEESDAKQRLKEMKQAAKAESVLVPVTPVVGIPTVTVPARQYTPMQTYQQQLPPQYEMPYARAQPVQAVPVQQQSNQISPTSLLTSGLLGKMLAPPAMVSDPQAAAQQLIPQLVTPSLQPVLGGQGGQQNPQLAERQLGMNGLGGNLGGMQQPYGSTGIPAFGTASPSLGNMGYSGYPQNTMQMQNPQLTGSLMPNMYNRGYDGMNTQYNPNMYGATGAYPNTGLSNMYQG